MNKINLHLYKDKIKKLHKATVEFKKIHDEFNEFQQTKLFGANFDSSDWSKLDEFFQNNPELQKKLDDVEATIKAIGE